MKDNSDNTSLKTSCSSNYNGNSSDEDNEARKLTNKGCLINYVTNNRINQAAINNNSSIGSNQPKPEKLNKFNFCGVGASSKNMCDSL